MASGTDSEPLAAEPDGFQVCEWWRGNRHEILSQVVDGIGSDGFLSDAIDEGHAVDDVA